MNRQIYVNLPVRDLARSKEFFSALGFEFEPKFTDEKAASLIVGKDSYVMLLSETILQNVHEETSRRRHEEHRGAGVSLMRKR